MTWRAGCVSDRSLHMNGLLVIDKPSGMTSRDVVNRVQKWFPRKTKIGHTGTLDPLATGVLVVCIGAATRLADYVQAMGKSYASRFRFGATSTTDDADGSVTETPDAVPPTREQVEAALASFVGTIEQMPPAFSALKIDGKRAHKLARAGKDVPLAARRVRIDAIRLVSYEWPFADVEVDCGKGTYIRSIARDAGERLGVGGMVQTLRRTRVGPYLAEDAVGLDLDPSRVGEDLVPMSSAVSLLPTVRVWGDNEARFRCGQVVEYTHSAEQAAGVEVCVLGWLEGFVGIGTTLENQRVKPQIVFPV
ncbi:MAG: tRNA pseudouridine(55) synthase TruB [Planctomycetaceae bacterium]|nr:tRNA pseudouridine(55) synthase TruB [Planctomycetaceae bacterium]